MSDIDMLDAELGMPDLDTPEETPDETKRREERIISGVSFKALGYPRRFNKAEDELFHEVAARHNYYEGVELQARSAKARPNESLSKLNKQLDDLLDEWPSKWKRDSINSLALALARFGQRRSATQLKIYQAVDKHLSKQLEKLEYTKPEYIEYLAKCLEEEGAEHERLAEEEKSLRAQEALKTYEEMGEFAALQERVYSETCYELAKMADAYHNNLDAFLAAMSDDVIAHENAAKVVEEGKRRAALERANQRARPRLGRLGF